MERLTKRINGEAVFHECSDTCGTCDGTTCFDIGHMVDHLAAYEDTGLCPEEVEAQSIALAQCKPYIDAICDEHGKMLINPIRLAELAQAEKDGRLAVLPEKVGTKKYEILRNASGWYNLVEMCFEKPCVWPTRYILASFKTKEEAETERERRMSNGTAD